MQSTITRAQHIHRARVALLKNLTAYRHAGVNRVKILNGSDAACPACAALQGSVLTIEEALRSHPLPCRSCTGGWKGGPSGVCRCDYLPLVEGPLREGPAAGR